MKPKITVIVGPTASGKSALALRLALATSGTIINADAIQTYHDLSIISARPTPAETGAVPHLLYGYLGPNEQSSVQDWLTRVVPVLKDTPNPILVGGTGLYISALINGLNDMPDIPPEVRAFVRQMDIDEVRRRMPDFPFPDPQRQRRALEVLLASGRPLSYFQSQPKKKVLDVDFRVLFINPNRADLYENCANRFHQMIGQGGIEEVQHLLTLNPTGGVLEAIGVSEITSYLQGVITREQMIKSAILATRHYAKRQVTWFRHQIPADIVIRDSASFDLTTLPT